MSSSRVILVSILTVFCGCTTLPSANHKEYAFPKEEAYSGDVKRPYQVLGEVRTKVDFTSLDEQHEEAALCRNYYNKAVRQLIELAHDRGGDAVIDVKSVVFLADGRREVYSTPECSDDGMEGQILTQGIAVRWKLAERK